MKRFLIVNADDFGLTPGINRGIAQANERGILTSASLMVRHAGAREATDYARAHPGLSVGLHFDLAEWRFQDGNWEIVYQVVDPQNAEAVRAELDRQLALFETLLGHPPTHLDSHQHAHRTEPAQSVLRSAARTLGVPLRHCAPAIRHCGDFYGQTAEGVPFPEGISLGHLTRIIEALPPGWTELGCHPGFANDLDSIYAAEREEETRVLCDRQIRDVIRRNAVELRSFPQSRTST